MVQGYTCTTYHFVEACVTKSHDELNKMSAECVNANEAGRVDGSEERSLSHHHNVQCYVLAVNGEADVGSSIGRLGMYG